MSILFYDPPSFKGQLFHSTGIFLIVMVIEIWRFWSVVGHLGLSEWKGKHRRGMWSPTVRDGRFAGCSDLPGSSETFSVSSRPTTYVFHLISFNFWKNTDFSIPVRILRIRSTVLHIPKLLWSSFRHKSRRIAPRKEFEFLQSLSPFYLT